MATRDYREWKLPQLWEMVSGDAGSIAVRHLNTWEHQAAMVDAQRTRLRELRTELEAKWPPDKSEAAAAFVGRIKDMIQAMDDTVTASTTIRNGLKLVVEAIDRARRELRPLLDQYHDRDAAWRAFNQRPMPLVGKGLPPSSPGAMEQARAWRQAQLDERARDSMMATDAKVTEANQQIRTELPKYSRIDEAVETLGPQGPEQGLGARSGGSSSGVDARPVPLVPPPIFDPPPPLPAGSGPVLAGGPSAPGGLGAIPGTGTGTTGVSPSGTNGGVLAPPGINSWSVRTGSGQTVMRPGGVIGEPPATNARTSALHPGGMFGGVAPGGQARPARRSTAHEAVGRVLGEPHDSSPHPVTGIGGWRDSQYDEYARRRRRPTEPDPDNPWAVVEGVPAVLDAPAEPVHTAGPGVIGLDR
jgi:hypothetical protein